MVEAKSEMVSRVTDDEAVEVLVKEPIVSAPKVAFDPVTDEDAAMLPVKFPFVPASVP